MEGDEKNLQSRAAMTQGKNAGLYKKWRNHFQEIFLQHLPIARKLERRTRQRMHLQTLLIQPSGVGHEFR